MENTNTTTADRVKHFKKIDEMTLPPILTQFAFWKEKPTRSHYIDVMAVEANMRAKRIDDYALGFCAVEKLTSTDVVGMFFF